MLRDANSMRTERASRKVKKNILIVNGNSLISVKIKIYWY